MNAVEVLLWTQLIAEKILLVEMGAFFGLVIALSIKKYEGPPIKIMYEVDIDSV